MSLLMEIVMPWIDVTAYVGDAEVTLSCLVKDGSVEKVTPYFNGRRHPKLQRWAEAWLDSDEGCDAVACTVRRLGVWSPVDAGFQPRGPLSVRSSSTRALCVGSCPCARRACASCQLDTGWACVMTNARGRQCSFW